MHGKKPFDRLELDDNPFFDQQVNSQPGVDPKTIIEDRKRPLLIEPKAALVTLMRQTRLIYGC